uniref:Methyltransferase domain-containing protein n=1 Tax=Colletotrichum fructicola (strain Nara gc5) TaxID=1213859 RepID=L2FAS6_COLFN
MIAAAEKEVLAYRRDNEGMKGALRARGLRVPEELKGKEKDVVVGEVRIAAAEETPVEEPSYEEFQQEQTDTQVFSAEEQQMLPEDVSMAQSLDYDPYPPADLFGDVNMGDITVTMSKDATLGTPCFQISSSSTSSLSTPVRPATPDQLSPEQEIIAINLILAMEHICWDHFHPRQYPRHADATKAASGHTMMASTMCMSSAPERVYRSIRRREVETQHTWHASGAGSSLTLRSLLSLAKTLNPGDIELTPVQAWFELAARYGAQALMQEPVIEALKREFCGVVDCIHFGAIIERDAFESVVARVMAEVGVPELPWEGMDVDVVVIHGTSDGSAQVDHEIQIGAEDNSPVDDGAEVQSIASSSTSLSESLRDYHFENGRTYHRYKEGKYHFPNDEKENDRLDLQHHLALLTLGGKLGLAPPCDPAYKVRRALDIGTGTGIWAIQFADDHPETEVLGVDLSPTQPDFVAPNVKFEVDDIEDEWTYTKPFEYIHSRHMTSSLADWKANITPGGYLELQEAEMAFLSDDDTLPADSALVRFGELLRGAGTKFGRNFVVASELKGLMADVGFENVTLSKYKWPLGTWPKDPHFKEIGMFSHENAMMAADGLAMAPLTRAYEWTRDEVEVFLVDVRKDLKNRAYHAYVPMYFLVGRKPMTADKEHSPAPAATPAAAQASEETTT